MRVRVAVPNGLTPGQVFGVFTSSYKLRVTVPPGVTGGQLLYITFTPPPTQKTEKEIIDISGDFISNEEEWKLNLEWVKKYIDKNKKRPSQRNKNKDVKTYGIWICHQIQNYQKKQKIVSNESIRRLWEDFINDDKYKNYFLTNEEEWKLNLEWIKKYIDENKKRPSTENKKDKYIKIHGEWISTQQKNYRKKQYNMIASNIRKLWEDFINDDKYKEYFLSNEEVWKSKLEWVKKYINENKKRPSSIDKNEDVKTHGNWIYIQINNYKKKQRIMSNESIRRLWEDFINEYKNYFK